MRLRSVPRVGATSALDERHLAHVGADFGDFDFVEVPEVVSKIELGECEGDAEAGLVGRLVLFSKECDDMAGSITS